MRLLAIAGFALATFSFGPGQVEASIMAFQQGVNGYTGTEDVIIITHQPNSNLNDATLGNDIADNAPANFLQPLLRFDLSAIPLGSKINSATLTMTVYNGGSGVFVHRVLESWDESSTYNSLNNGVDQFVAAFDDGLGVQSHTKFVPETAIDFDVTASLKAWTEEGQANYGWVLLAPHPSGTDSVGMWSSEHAVVSERPLLTVRFDPIPEPSTRVIWALLTVGIAGGAWHRRRRRVRAGPSW